MSIRRAYSSAIDSPLLAWRQRLYSRRQFLLTLLAGGSLSALMPLSRAAESGPPMDDALRWSLLDAVQQHLFPSEPDAPGAREIQALDYLRFVVSDQGLDAEERAFLLRGPEWLEDLTRQMLGSSFLDQDAAKRERMLRHIAASEAGENWLSSLQLYICEALLADPIYGGNPQGIGWQWLGHNPGFPRPNADNRYRGS